MQAYEIYQKMSNDVYILKNGGMLTDISGLHGEIWILEKTYSANQNTGVENIYTVDGYFGAIYQNDKTGEIVVVNGGTDVTALSEVSHNGIENNEMIKSLVSQQYNSARQIMQDALSLAAKHSGTVSSTGDSLGGALSQMQAVEFGVHSVTFNYQTFLGGALLK